MEIMNLKLLLLLLCCLFAAIFAQSCRENCQPPDCSCPRFSYPMDRKEIPQMVYFGFDDAVNVVMASLYDRIFIEERKNPNGCPIKMTLFISHQYTDYKKVKAFYEQGHEIAVHSVTHSAIDHEELLREEARQQKENLQKLAGVPANEIIGWRSPFLKPAGNSQPVVLKELGYEYDITLTYSRPHLDVPKPWPHTMDFGWPYRCGVPPCPTSAKVTNFWAVPVVSLMDHKDQYPCSFVDGCVVRANDEDEAYKFLMDNFLSYYNTTRTPFGLNMHAAWFYTRYNLKAMMRFLDDIAKMDDVYVVTVKQMLDWMKRPTPVSDIYSLESWQCNASRAMSPVRTRAEQVGNFGMYHGTQYS